jgi:hypothetical protein
VLPPQLPPSRSSYEAQLPLARRARPLPIPLKCVNRKDKKRLSSQKKQKKNKETPKNN